MLTRLPDAKLCVSAVLKVTKVHPNVFNDFWMRPPVRTAKMLAVYLIRLRTLLSLDDTARAVGLGSRNTTRKLELEAAARVDAGDPEFLDLIAAAERVLVDELLSTNQERGVPCSS